jgi:hypothetical protein
VAVSVSCSDILNIGEQAIAREQQSGAEQGEEDRNR